MWFNRRFELAFVECNPVYLFEPRVTLDVASATALITKSSRRIQLQQFPDEIFSFGRHRRWVADIAFHNPFRNQHDSTQPFFVASLLFINLHRVLVPERWLPNEKFIDKDPKCPPVDGRTMPCSPLNTDIIKLRIRVDLPLDFMVSGERYSWILGQHTAVQQEIKSYTGVPQSVHV